MNNKPAFPTVDANRELDHGTTGMTLRDYFAARVLHVLYSEHGTYDKIAANAYLMADAMMEARGME